MRRKGVAIGFAIGLSACGSVVVPGVDARGDEGAFDAVPARDEAPTDAIDVGSLHDRTESEIAPSVDASVDDALIDAAIPNDRANPTPRSTPLVCGNRSYGDLALACSDAFRDAGVPRAYRTGSILCCADQCVLATTCGGDAGPPACGASGRACGEDEVCCWHPSVRRFRCVSPVPESNCATPF
jgi:hypothetical protein